MVQEVWRDDGNGVGELTGWVERVYEKGVLIGCVSEGVFIECLNGVF